jgi:hypothetical protein
MPTCKALESWSVGPKSGNKSDFFSFTFGYGRSKNGFYLSNISTIHYSITPSLQYSRYDKPPSLAKRAWLPFTNGGNFYPAPGLIPQ